MYFLYSLGGVTFNKCWITLSILNCYSPNFQGFILMKNALNNQVGMLGDMFLWLVANLKQGVIYFIKQGGGNHKIAWVYMAKRDQFYWHQDTMEQWTFDFLPLCFQGQRLASTASKREGANNHRKIGFLMINPIKRGSPCDWGHENHSVYKALAFLVILRSKRLSRSSRLLRLSWLMEPMRPLMSSDPIRNLNSII